MKTNPLKNLDQREGTNASQRASRWVKWAVLTLSAAVLVACGGGGGGSSPAEVPNANNLAPANVKLLEVSSAAVGQITASWLPATDDATPAGNLMYQLHASTDAAFTPSSSTKLFEGQAIYQAVVKSGLTAGAKYTVKLVVVDGQGASTSSDGFNVTVSDTAVTLVAGAKVTPLAASQVANVNGNQVTLQAGAAAVQVGQFIANASGETGSGFLKKVESVTTSAGNTVLQTRNASINEVISDVKISSSFKLASLPKEIGAAAQQAGLVQAPGNASTGLQNLVWPQSGYRYQVPTGTASASTGLPAQWGTKVQAGLTQGELITKQGGWGKLVLPKYLVLSEGETANFNIHGYITDTSDPRFGDPRQICKLEFGAMWGEGKDSKPIALNLSADSPEGNHWVDFRHTHLTYPATLKVSAGAAHVNAYKVDVKLRIEERDEGCEDQIWDETVTETLTIYVVNDAGALREKETLPQKTFTGTAGFTVKNDVTMSFQPSVAFDKEMSGSKLGYARIQLDAAPLLEQTLSINATASGSMDTQAMDLMNPRKFYKVYMAGSVPIVITGTYTLKMRIQGSVTGAMNATEKLTMGYDQLSYGLEYRDGQYKLIKNIQPVYRVNLGGDGKAEANLVITLEPGLELTAYEALTGKVVLVPYLDANAGIEGLVKMDTEVDFNAVQPNVAADADWRITKADLGGGVKLRLGADLSVWDKVIYAWPNKDDKNQLQEYDLIERTVFWGIPSINAAADFSVKHSTNSRALLVKGVSTPKANPLKTLFPSLPDAFVTWSKWTNPRIVPSLATPTSSYSILDESLGSDATWVEFSQPGTYTVRQGGYSSMGTWARQYVETTIEIKDANSNGIPDWWEQRYSLTGSGAAIAAADPDGDGLTNLQEWQQGSDPNVITSNTLSASPNTASIGQTVQLWLINAWSTIKSVVFTFADGVADFVNKAATVDANGLSQKISGIFTKSGEHTVTATYIDANGNTLGTGTLKIKVKPADAEITQVINDNTTPNSFIPKDTTTTDSTPKITGTVSAVLSDGDVVRLYSGATLLGTTTTANSSTSWTFTPASALAAGQHVLKATVYNAYSMTEGNNANTWTITVSGTSATSKLPHSGITASQCYSAGSNTLMTCSGVASDLNGQQDGHRTGINAMSYSAVTNPAGGSYPITSCVKDNVTGLIWEGKEASSTRSGSNTYTNYDSTASAQKYNGTVYVNPTAADIAASTNSMGYIAAVNAMALCGYTDWRLPTVDELQTIVDYSKPSPGPTINTTWFPNTPSGSYYWTSSPDVGSSSYAWYVLFGSGGIDYYSSHGRSQGIQVRLVRVSQ